MAFDSYITKSSSRITGTRRFGLHASSSGSCSTCSKRRSSSAQVHSTLRTLMEAVRPSMRNAMARLLLLALDALDLAVDDGHHHGRRTVAAVVDPGLDDGLAHLHV